MTSSERVADHIAGVLMGLVLASVLATVMAWLWPEMRLAVFIMFLVAWGFTTIGTIILRRHNLVPNVVICAWNDVKPSEIGKRAMSLSLRGRIWGDTATTLFGIIVGLVAAGLIGKVWPVFAVVFLLWMGVIVTAIAANRRGALSGANGANGVRAYY